VNVTTLRVLEVDDWRQWRELRLEALGEAPRAFGSKLADWQGPGDTEQRWRDRLSSVPLNIIADLEQKLAGMVSATSPESDGAIALISMWVAPFARGRGVGDALVTAVIEWAKEQGQSRVALDVMETNRHAANLYLRHGFVDVGLADVPEGAPIERRMVLDLHPAVG
jgi:ribosomal protein S18 acetylase RimI-like enzyme